MAQLGLEQALQEIHLSNISLYIYTHSVHKLPSSSPDWNPGLERGFSRVARARARPHWAREAGAPSPRLSITPHFSNPIPHFSMFSKHVLQMQISILWAGGSGGQ